MGTVRFVTNTKQSDLGFFGAVDLQLNAVLVDCFYLICLRREYDVEKGPREYWQEYGLETLEIEFSNPFEWLLKLRNVSKLVTKDTITAIGRVVGDRTLFYAPEYRARSARAAMLEQRAIGKKIANQEAEQTVIKKKLANFDRALRLKKRLIKGAVKDENALRILAALLENQGADLKSDE